MPTDPSDPSSPTPPTRPYETTSDAPKGGGGIFFIILLVLLLAGGAAYYFLMYKPAAAAPVAASASPAPSAAPTAKPTPKNDYGNAERAAYVAQASKSFVALRDAKLQPFNDAFNAMMAAGGFQAAGLTSKEAIAARRELVSKCITTNDDYQGFVRTQEATLKAELQKTPLIPSDVDYVAGDYSFKAQTDKNVQLRDLRRDSLKSGDEMLAFLDKTFGNWSVNAAQHLSFKKPADTTAFVALQKTYNDQVAAMTKLRDEITPAGTDPASVVAGSPAPSPAASSAPTAAAPSPAASATP